MMLDQRRCGPVAGTGMCRFVATVAVSLATACLAAGAAKVEMDAKCEVVSRSDDELVFWTETEKDSALFFRFANN